MTFARSLILTLGIILATGTAAQAHRPYFTQVEPIILPDGQAGEMRILRGDGIITADPARILVLDRDGRLLARSRQSRNMVLLCDRERRSCRGYDGVDALILDPATFRQGMIVPGLSERDRDDLWSFEAGEESWGFAAGWPAISDILRGEILLARDMGDALAVLLLLGAIAAILAVVGLWRPRNASPPSSAIWAFRVLLCLVGQIVVLPMALFGVVIFGVSATGGLASFGVGVMIVLVLYRLIRSRPAAPSPIA